ncbi:MAG: hypothetical protein ACR2RL_03045 [Gammaproteobacteria bacterium]
MPADAQSITIGKPAADVFAFMSDPARMDLWSFGTFEIVRRDDGLVEGRSLFDGATVFVRIDPAPDRWLIDYHVGDRADALTPRIFARISPGPLAGLDESACVLTLVAVRSATMSDERWERLVASHAFELQLLKSLIETGYDHRRRSALE